MLKAIKNLNEYYDYMYDIENLTDLNVKVAPETDKEIINIENLVRKNKCIQAKRLIDRKLIKNKNCLKAVMIKRALESYSFIASSFYLSEKDNLENLSPKTHALKELSKYLDKKIATIEPLMKVEEPVAKDWKKFKINPKDEKSVTDFYINTDSYIYELMAANNIIQTLYSYKIMSEKLKRFNINTILDYGAGAGTISILLENMGYNVIYADIGGKTFNFAKWRIENRNLKIPMIDLLEQDINELNFDCIICLEVIEHLVRPLKLLEKFSKNLSKKQILVISESCKYTRQFVSHLESNRKYGGKNFIKIMKDFGFKQILSKSILPQLFFEKNK